MIVCLRLPDFAVRLERERQPTLNNAPLLLSEQRGKRELVYAVCDRAWKQGVRPGMRLPGARALCPTANVVPAVESRYRRSFREDIRRLLDYTDRLEPEYRPLGPLCYLDFGSLRQEDILQLCEDIAHRFEAQVGVSGGKFAAFVAAVTSKAGVVASVPTGEEAAFIAPHPLTLLPTDRETARRFDLFGMKTLGQLASLPSGGVLAQFGKTGLELHRLACGEDWRRVLPYLPPRLECAGRAFETPLEDRLQIETALMEAAEGVLTRFDPRCEVARTLTLTVTFADGLVVEDTRTPRDGVESAALLFRLLSDGFSRLPIHAPIAALEVTLTDFAEVLPVQLALFEPPAEDGERFKLALEAAAFRQEGTPFYHAVTSGDGGYLPERQFRFEVAG